MNGKSAIILQGQLRFFDCFFENFNKNIEGFQNKTFFFNFQNSSDIDKLNYLENIYNPNISKILESKSLDDLISYFNVKNTEHLPKNLLFQLYYLHTSFLMVEEYQSKYNVNFDLYLRSRTDLYYINKHSEKLENGICYVPKNKYNFLDQICDFSIATKDFNIYKICSEIGFCLDEILNSFKAKNKKPDQFGDRADKSIPVYCSEQILFEYLNIKNVKTKAIFEIDLARHFKGNK